jgi:hypothetical protein
MDRVYFFHNGSECKIGCTENDLRHRLWAAHVWSPRALEILGWVEAKPGEKTILEKQIHLAVAHLRLVKPSGNGEWFKLSRSEALETIKKYEGNQNNYTYGHASRHPAHHVRPLRGRQQNETAGDGEILYHGVGPFGHSMPKLLFTTGGTKHAIGGQAFLRKAGA